jgi:pimeloyl-ACP methyl ester carboxylesterase
VGTGWRRTSRRTAPRGRRRPCSGCARSWASSGPCSPATTCAAASPRRSRAASPAPSARSSSPRPCPVRERILSGDAQREFWYQPFHRLPLAHELLDGRPEALGPYLAHFWEHWSAPGWSPDPVLWGEHEPLFPVAWADRLPEHFADAELRVLPGVGHFAPLEAPEAFAAAVRERAGA